MPTSFAIGKTEIRDFLLQQCDSNTKVLDVGPGQGNYSFLFRKHVGSIDACELHGPYIKRHKLSEKYDTVYNMSVVDFPDFDKYDLVIMGDILEHLTVEEAKAVIEKCKNVKQMLIAVPFEMKQHAGGGRPASEEHIQDDLTPENFAERYPDFEPAVMVKRQRRFKFHCSDYSYGYYVRKGTVNLKTMTLLHQKQMFQISE